MFNLFKKNEDTKENNVSLIAVCSLLIHSAKIDENYTEKEKNIIIKALIEMGAKDENLGEIVKEAEKNDIKDYPLYHWTKSVVQDPDKQIKHSKSFAFYFGDEQIYDKERAVSLYNDLVEFNDKNKIEEIKMIDSNPRNNPQPPKNKN